MSTRAITGTKGPGACAEDLMPRLVTVGLIFLEVAQAKEMAERFEAI
jgi:hypothetical protein